MSEIKKLENRIKKLEENNIKYEAFVNLAKYIIGNDSPDFINFKLYKYVWNVDNPVVMTILTFYKDIYNSIVRTNTPGSNKFKEKLSEVNNYFQELYNNTNSIGAFEYRKKLLDIYFNITKLPKHKSEPYTPPNMTLKKWTSIYPTILTSLSYMLLPLFIVIPNRFSPAAFVNNRPNPKWGDWRLKHNWHSDDTVINLFLSGYQENILRTDTLYPKVNGKEYISTIFYKDRIEFVFNDILGNKNDPDINYLPDYKIPFLVTDTNYNVSLAKNKLGV